MKKHDWLLIWTLAKTDFKLRYQGSVLGYLWSLLKPLLMFSIMYLVFSSFIAKNSGNPYYALELILGVVMFNFFAEGTTAGLNSLLSKSYLIAKVRLPMAAIIMSSTLNALFVFLLNLLIVGIFFIFYPLVPGFFGILIFGFFVFLLYLLILSFSLLTAPLQVKFRDLSVIWEVIVSSIFYATPIIYPLSIIPIEVRKYLLFNPLTFLFNYTKESLIHNNFPLWSSLIWYIIGVVCFFFVSWWCFRKFKKNIVESI